MQAVRYGDNTVAGLVPSQILQERYVCVYSQHVHACVDHAYGGRPCVGHAHMGCAYVGCTCLDCACVGHVCVGCAHVGHACVLPLYAICRDRISIQQALANY